MSRRTVPLSVIVCTRDRPAELQHCLDNLAGLDPRPQQVIVIDQSSAPVPPDGHDLPMLYRPTMMRGMSIARNEGLGLVESPIVAFMDDDCFVETGWAGDVLAAFDRHPDAGIVFGKVVAIDWSADTYIPAYAIAEERRLKGRLCAATAHGIGAAMYLRASTAARVGTFDLKLGAGAQLRGSEDWDYTFRALAAGIVIVEAPDVVVHHYGARRYADGSASTLLRLNAFSHGAIHAKLLRCLDPIALVLIGSEVLSMVSLLRPHNVIRRRPTNAARLAMYVRGFAAAMKVPVRRRERIFGSGAA